MKQVYLPLAIGIVGFAIAATLLIWGGQLISAVQVEVSDLFMVRANGPRFGARLAHPDIALVLFDKKTADSLGYVHSFPTDLDLYRRLIAAEAKVVFDTRMIAAADAASFVELGPLLDGMSAINNRGKLMRDIWLSSELLTKHDERVDLLFVQNIINSHPHEIPSVGSRLYPLAYFDARGVHESAPLTICREYWDTPRATSIEVGDELRHSGIMSQWHEIAPKIVAKTLVPRSAYNCGEHQLEWHPFVPSSILVPPAAFWISYDPPISGYDRFSYIDILRETVTPDLKGKIVLVGFAAEIDPTSDTYIIPNMLSKAAAAEVVACATQTILDHRKMREVPRTWALTLAAVLILGITMIAGLASPLRAIIGTVLAVLCYYAFAILAYRADWYADFIIAPGMAVLSGVPAGAANAWANLRARQRVVDLFGRYVPRAIVNQLMQRSELENLTLGGVKREVTVLFADIRGFTDFSQDLAPEEVVRQLNSLLEVMVKCTFENEGTLDKFIGDAILVLFNAPLDQQDHSLRAVRTAVSIQQRLQGHASGLGVGIGVHRGVAVVGNIGTPQRMEYTAIGSTVNIASRLCDLARSGEIVVSDAVLPALQDNFGSTSLGSVKVKGINGVLQIARINTLDTTLGT